MNRLGPIPLQDGVPPSPSRFTRQSTFLLCMLAAVNFLNYADRILFAALAHPIQVEFGLSDTQLGALSGLAFSAFYMGLALPMGRWADVGVRKNILALSLSIWSVLTMVCGAAQSFLHLLIARMGIGVGEAGCLPTGYSMIADAFPARSRALAIAIFNAGSMLGTMCGLAVGGWIATHWGWRSAFLVLGLPGVLLALVLMLFATEPRRRIEHDSALRASMGDTLRALWRNAPYRLLTVGASINAFFVIGMPQWLPLFFVRSHKMPPDRAGLLFGLVLGCGMTAGLILSGWWADRLARRSPADALRLSIGVATATPLLYAVALLTPWTGPALAAFFLAAMASVMSSPAQNLASLSVCQPRVHGMAMAVQMLLATLVGIAIVPFSVGMLSDWLRPQWGDDSLRVGLSISLFVGVFTIALYIRARALMLSSAERKEGDGNAATPGSCETHHAFSATSRS